MLVNLRAFKLIEFFDDLPLVFYGPKVIDVTIWESCFKVKVVKHYLFNTIVSADAMCFERMVVEQQLKYDMNSDLH